MVILSDKQRELLVKLIEGKSLPTSQERTVRMRLKKRLKAFHYKLPSIFFDIMLLTKAGARKELFPLVRKMFSDKSFQDTIQNYLYDEDVIKMTIFTCANKLTNNLPKELFDGVLDKKLSNAFRWGMGKYFVDILREVNFQEKMRKLKKVHESGIKPPEGTTMRDMVWAFDEIPKWNLNKKTIKEGIKRIEKMHSVGGVGDFDAILWFGEKGKIKKSNITRRMKRFYKKFKSIGLLTEDKFKPKRVYLTDEGKDVYNYFKYISTRPKKL